MHILLLSAYDADSHVRLRTGLAAQFPDAEITAIALPPRYYAWRAGGSALSFAERIPRRDFDVVLTMGPTDLAALLGLRPDLTRARRLVYVHEHEFAYPDNAREQGRVDRQMRQVLALLAADAVLVNSRYAADSLLDGIRKLLAAMPDAVPKGLEDRIAERITVEPVPLPDALFARPRQRPAGSGGCWQLVWNHRHEWDKGPERLPPLLNALFSAGFDFRLHLLGQRFRRRPAALAQVEALLNKHPEHLGSIGFVADRRAYLDLLGSTDLVISTALQEFQGLAVMDAVALGCVPCVPDRLAYRDWIPDAFRTPSHAADPAADGHALAARILSFAEAGVPEPIPDLSFLAWSRRRRRWRAHLEGDALPASTNQDASA